MGIINATDQTTITSPAIARGFSLAGSSVPGRGCVKTLLQIAELPGAEICTWFSSAIRSEAELRFPDP